MTPYQDLIQRVESGEVSRELDFAIADAVLGPVKPPYRRGHCEKYTSSLDAAMSLVPEGWDWLLSKGAGEDAYAALAPAMRVTEVCGNAPTPAAALVSASLRAKQALIEEERG